MENNEQMYQQQNYQNTEDPAYLAAVNPLLKKAIVACVLAAFPIVGIVGCIMGAKNKSDLLHYLEYGRRTPRTKTVSILSSVALGAGIGLAVFYLIYFLAIGSAIFALQ